MDVQFDRAEQIRHAYIISSPTSDRSFNIALQIAQAAVCRGHGMLPCGTCSACRKVSDGTHPDVVLIERPSDDKGKKKRELPVDTVRAISADAAVLPNESERKVYIFRDGDLMNIEAQNAALKLLEEPPKAVIFLLCVTNPQKLLSTVRSRCTLMTFSGEFEDTDSELSSLAEEYLQLVARGNALALWKFCEENNTLSNAEMTDFCLLAIRKITDILCSREDNIKLSQARLLALESQLEQCIRMLNVNVGVKQVFGLLEIHSLPEAKGRKQIKEK